MSQWVLKGIRTGIKTTGYPRDVERAAGVTPGCPVVATSALPRPRSLHDA